MSKGFWGLGLCLNAIRKEAYKNKEKGSGKNGKSQFIQYL